MCVSVKCVLILFFGEICISVTTSVELVFFTVFSTQLDTFGTHPLKNTEDPHGYVYLLYKVHTVHPPPPQTGSYQTSVLVLCKCYTPRWKMGRHKTPTNFTKKKDISQCF